MAENDNRYGGNRNLWRKVRGFVRHKPKVVTFRDTFTSRSLTFDLNQTYRHRDYFLVDDVVLQPTASGIRLEYDEGLVYLDNATQVLGNFNFQFTKPPIVVYSVEPTAQNASNINVFGVSCPTENGFVAGTSAPFTGFVRYRAVYSNSDPAYPAHIEHGVSPKIISPYTSSFDVYAGEIAVTDATVYTASYTLPSGVLLTYRASPHDCESDKTANVKLNKVNVSFSQSTNTISSRLTNRIHFMVTRRDPIIGQYDEGLVYFNNESEQSGTYNIDFDAAPYVVYTMEPTSNSLSNVNVYGASLPTPNNFVIKLSAPFSGAVRYRAIYSDEYPALVSSSYTSSQFYAFGGQVNANDDTEFDAYYNLPFGVLEYRDSTHDALLNGSANVSLLTRNISLTASNNSISSLLTNKIHFIAATTTAGVAEYDEGVITFDGETEKLVTFNFAFSNDPYVVFTFEDSLIDDATSINFFGVDYPSVTGSIVGASAPFSGSVRYRAVYSPTYPAFASSSYSSSFKVFAGKLNFNEATQFTASFQDLGAPVQFRTSPHDRVGDDSSDVAITKDSITSTKATNTISAPLTNEIHFIVATP